jgi:hypothetical protein
LSFEFLDGPGLFDAFKAPDELVHAFPPGTEVRRAEASSSGFSTGCKLPASRAKPLIRIKKSTSRIITSS